MKETSLYTGDTDTIATSLENVSEKLSLQLPMLKKPYHQNTQSTAPKEQHERDADHTSHRKLRITRRIERFPHIRLRHR